jgi:hypothetical protein
MFRRRQQRRASPTCSQTNARARRRLLPDGSSQSEAGRAAECAAELRGGRGRSSRGAFASVVPGSAAKKLSRFQSTRCQLAPACAESLIVAPGQIRGAEPGAAAPLRFGCCGEARASPETEDATRGCSRFADYCLAGAARFGHGPGHHRYAMKRASAAETSLVLAAAHSCESKPHHSAMNAPLDRCEFVSLGVARQLRGRPRCRRFRV